MSLPKRPHPNKIAERTAPPPSQDERVKETERFYQNDSIDLDSIEMDFDEKVDSGSSNLSGELSGEVQSHDDDSNNLLDYEENDLKEGHEDYSESDEFDLLSRQNHEDPMWDELESEDQETVVFDAPAENATNDDSDDEPRKYEQDARQLEEDYQHSPDDDDDDEYTDVTEDNNQGLTEETLDDDNSTDGHDEIEVDFFKKETPAPKNVENKLPRAPRLPSAPAPRVPSASRVPTRPRSLNSERIMQHIEDSRSIEEKARANPDLFQSTNKRNEVRTEPVKREVTKLPERNKMERYGGIDAEFAVNGDYNIYAHLEDKIHEMVNEIQQVLSDQGKSEEIGEARRARNTDKFYNAVSYIDRLVTRSLSKDGGISVEMVDTKYFTAAVVNEILGFGPLEPLWGDPTISEIMMNGPYSIRVERNGKTQIATGVRFRDKDHAMKAADSLLSFAGRPFNVRSPQVDSSLPDGSRINAVHPEIAPNDGPMLTIRRFPDTVFSMEKLVEYGSMDEDMAATLGNLVNKGVSIVVAGGTGTGKALSVDTPIPTPSGLIRLGDLEVGDTVYTETGQPTTITHVFDQPDGRECFLLRMNDGSTVIADAEHNWFVNNEIFTTKEIYASEEIGEWRIPLTKAVQYPEQELPIDPYLLGFWLACSNPDGRISGENPVVETILKERGVKFNRVFRNHGIMLEIAGFNESLSALGLSDGLETTKPLVIPEGYLIASEEQRRALLAGILDNDAILHEKDGKIEIVINNNTQIAQQIIRLAGSLGICGLKKDLQYGDDLITTIIIETEQDVFYCKNLAEQHKESRGEVPNYKTIISIEPHESVKVRCITVNAPSHLYLFGEEHTVTHNTSMLNALSGCIPDDERILTVEDTLELQLNPKKWKGAMRSRPAGANGQDAITIRDIVKNTLRMRPDRIVVGEVRDESAYDMMQAMSTGHDGSLTTTHASNPEGTIERLALLSSQSGEISPDRALSLIAGAVDIIVNLERFHDDGSRRVVAVSEVPSKLTEINGRLALVPRVIWEWVRDGTDEDGKLYGHYEKVNELSESFNKKYALDKRKTLTIEEIYELSAVEMPGQKKED